MKTPSDWTLSAKIALGSNLLAIGAVALAWANALGNPPLSYPLHKFLHVSGVVLFMGNLIAGPVWLWFARYADDGAHYPWAARMLSDADIWLTVPGVQLAVWNGAWLAAALGGAAQHPWLVESLVLLIISSIFSVVVVLPWQEALVEAAQGDDQHAAQRALIQWSIWGSVVMVPFSLVAWLMVSKDALLL